MSKQNNQNYRAKRVDPARLLAVQILEAVHQQGAFANLALPKALRQEQQQNASFTFRDSAFTAELVYGTLRQQGYLDHVLQHFSSRALADLDDVVLEVLRIGAYQLLFMRVPDHAAVAETVDVARSLSTEGPAKMVNAILRAITRASEAEIDALFEGISDQTERLATRFSHPQWMVDSFADALGQRGIGRDELEEALAANNLNPKVTLVARPGLIATAELEEEVEAVLQRGTSQGEISPYAVIIDGGDPAALPALRVGQAAVQDEGSQLAAILVAEAPLEGPDRLWLDLCAGPGGKTALLAAIGAERGVTVVANEVNQRRSQLVERSVVALDNVRVRQSDGRTFAYPEAESGFDRVLVDAPCSGLGSLRRRPESRWRHYLEDLEELLPLQRDLFDRGLSLTRSGGVFAWVTCTPQVEETLEQIERALEQGAAELIDAATLAQDHSVLDLRWSDVNLGQDIAPLRRDVVTNTVQLWPHRHGTDAMFVALMRKL